ncbi:MAG: lysophospholipid acyltransferase family protein [Candidatus Omnitrophica bacterium]|nr:lysophospholipid acyltransferase family protein [Candidatus Omnitrophota bacterium]MDD5660670.1 lysophospholipid acyltransferase family protein [Candidatus Omnitrophota bacterium]
MKAIISIFIWIGSVLLTILLFFAVLVLTILLFPFDKKKKVTHRQCFWWSDAVIGLNPFWRVKVEGLKNIDHKKTYVIIANHQSMADIVVLYQIKAQFKWVAKASLFKVPFIGWCLSLIKHIKLTRGDFTSIKKIYQEASDWLHKDMSVLFFPEGTRSSNDQMGEYQNGAFKLAIKEKKPILPICIKGTQEAIPKGSWVFKTTVAASVRVLPEVATDGFSPGDFALLRDTVRSKIEEALLL